MATDENKANTEFQQRYHEAQEAAWAEEQTWPIYRIVLTGDEAEFVPRADTRYWMLEDEDDPQSRWVPKAAEDLPDDASLNEAGNVVRVSYATVTCHARSEDHAKMLALRDNPDYHTVESVEVLENAG